MKKFLKKVGALWAAVVLTLGSASAQNTYYVSTTGNNATGNGSAGSPWQTAAFAATQVAANQGHTIQVNAGVYMETGSINLPLGVNLKGAGIGSTILRANLTGEFVRLITNTGDGTLPVSANGNQTVSDLTLDGVNRTADRAIQVQQRNNVTVRNVEAKDFRLAAMSFYAGFKNNIEFEAPGYITGLLVENNVIRNSGADPGFEVDGGMRVGGLDGAIIRNNLFDLNTRPVYGLKFQVGGWFKNVQLIGNTFDLIPNISSGSWQGPPFAIEWFNVAGGNVFSNNVFEGTLSLVAGQKYTSTWSLQVLNNRFNMPPNNGFWVEEAINDIEIANNYVVNGGGNGIKITGTGNNFDNLPRTNVRIHHNIVDNTGVPGETRFVTINSQQYSSTPTSDVFIYNNTYFGGTRAVEINAPAGATNIHIKNNLINNVNHVVTGQGGGVTNLQIFNNRYAPGGNLVSPWGAQFINFTQGGNITSDPGLKLTGNKPAPYYEPAASSSAVVDAGTTAGLPPFAFQGNAPDIGAYEFSGSGTANQPPSVSLTSPANGSTFSAPASISLSANASDADGTVSKVEFFQGTTKLGEDLTSPYSYTWSNVAAGTYSLSARATDNAGAVTNSSSVSVTVSGSTFTGREPENPATTLGGLNYKYYQGLWDVLPNFNALTPAKTGSVANFDLSPRTVNDNFGFAYEGYVQVPSDGTYTFYTSSDDGSKLYIGSTEVVNNDGLHGAQERSGSLALKAGKHALRVVFFEQWGGELLEVRYQGPTIAKQLIPASALSRLSATSNQSPSVSLTSPANGATYTAPASISLSASASDADNTVSKVEFFQGTTKLGEDLTSPYSYSWTGVAAGTYSLSARATDNGGAVTTSSSVSVTVSAPTSSTALIDLSHGGGGYNSFGAPADEVKRYQTFLAGTNPRITSVEVKIRKYNGATQSNVTVELYATSANKPTGSPLASATIAASLVGTAGTVVSAPLSYSGLINGSKYAIVLGQQTPQGARYEWNVGAVSSSLEFGKYTGGTNYADESGLGDGWLKVYTSSSARLAAQRPAAIETIRVYPNPANQSVSIEADQANVDLFNARGQRVLIPARVAGEKSLSLDVSRLPAGVYLLKIKSECGQVTRRVVVQH